MSYKYKIKSISELKKFINNSTEYNWEEVYGCGSGISYSACMNIDMLSSDFVITEAKINNSCAVSGECFTIEGKSKGDWQWEPWMVKNYANVIMKTE